MTTVVMVMMVRTNSNICSAPASTPTAHAHTTTHHKATNDKGTNDYEKDAPPLEGVATAIFAAQLK